MKKKIAIGVGILLFIAQFFRPSKNESNIQKYSIETKYQVPTNVGQLLKVACNDCHSNFSKYPWYFNVQPVANMIAHHITDGKKHLNFSEFTNLPIAVQNHKFDEIIETIESKEMPDKSYTLFGLHKEADLNESERQILIDWAKKQMDELKSKYLVDSLILKQRH
jgi:hypothetical protein